MNQPIAPPTTPASIPRRPGRPPSNLMKVTVTVRIPADVDGFLTDYASKQGMFKGDIIADAVIAHFQLRQDPPLVQTANHPAD